MPSDNDKILQALIDSKTSGTDNQGITNVYNEQISVNEALGDQIGLAPSGITPGSGSHDRASVAMKRFLAGRGGGISQAVGKLLSYGGTWHDDLKARHSTMESANALYTGIIGLLQRHEFKLTGRQIKDYIGNVDIPELAGGKINVALLPSLSSINDTDTRTDKQIKELFQYVAKEIDDVIDTGGQRAVATDTNIVLGFEAMTATAIAAILTYIATKGWWPKP